MERFKHKLRGYLVLALGIIFLILGVLGLALPFLQGFLFLAIGLLLLSMYSPRIRAYVDRHTLRFPKVHAFFKKAEGWVRYFIGEL